MALRVVLIAGAVLWAFSPAFHGGWLWDDAGLITQSRRVHDPAGLWNTWFERSNSISYFPLTVSFEWLQWRLWHDDTFGYHLTNVILHLCSCLLIWRLFHQLGLKLAWLGGLIFAIHPVTVESVAWIAEIKNSLSLPPFLLAMCAYLDYETRGNKKDYWLAVGLFLVAMLCKPTMVMFPLVLLLFAWWKRGRIRWVDLLASMPFFAISLVLGGVTSYFVHHRSEGVTVPMGDILSLLARVGLTISFYFSTCIFPFRLMPIYPRWAVDSSSAVQFLPWPILIGVLAWCWTKRMTWGRHALLGLGFFLIILAPFVIVITMNYTWVMDHLVYIPLIGLVGLAVAALGNLEQLLPRSVRPLGIGTVAAVIALLAWKCHAYAAVFASEETLGSFTLAHNPQAWPAYDNLGAVFFAKGDWAKAAELYQRSLQLDPSYKTYDALGMTLMHTDQLPEAIAAFEASLQLDSTYPDAHNHLGHALAQAGRVSEAKKQFEATLRVDPANEYAQRFLAQIVAAENATIPQQ